MTQKALTLVVSLLMATTLAQAGGGPSRGYSSTSIYGKPTDPSLDPAWFYKQGPDAPKPALGNKKTVATTTVFKPKPLKTTNTPAPAVIDSNPQKLAKSIQMLESSSSSYGAPSPVKEQRKQQALNSASVQPSTIFKPRPLSKNYGMDDFKPDQTPETDNRKVALKSDIRYKDPFEQNFQEKPLWDQTPKDGDERDPNNRKVKDNRAVLKVSAPPQPRRHAFGDWP